jgi:hypothetical protein
MAGIERVYESASILPSPDEIKRRAADGWKLVSLIWEREIGPLGEPRVEEIPYGLRISDDCQHLTENPAEKEVLMLAMDLIVQDQKLSQVAVTLNERGYRTRTGAQWNAASVFNMLPRLVDTGPRIFTSAEWIKRHEAAIR